MATGPKLVDYLTYEPEESGILWIRFNRPDRLNALIGSSEENGTVAKVGEYMRAGDDDPKIRVIVLTGVGRVFCAGADLRGKAPKEVTGEDFVGNRGAHEGIDAARQHFFHGFTKLHRDISLIRKPTIAMINGPAVGAGMTPALACDFRICSEAAFFNSGYVNMGLSGDIGMTYHLTHVVGPARAREILFFPRRIDAQEALRIGLVNKVLPPDQLLDAARNAAKTIASMGPLAVAEAKKVLREGEGRLLKEANALEIEGFAGCFETEDQKEGMQAFLERRAPSFGRA